MTHSLTPRKDEAVARDRYVRAVQTALCHRAQDLLYSEGEAQDYYVSELGAALSIFEMAEGQDSPFTSTVHEAFELLYCEPEEAAKKILREVFQMEPPGRSYASSSKIIQALKRHLDDTVTPVE